MFSFIRKYKLKVSHLLIVFIFAIIALSLFLFLFRTKKNLIIVVKVNGENVIWPNKGISPWFGNLFSPGMSEKDSFSKSTAEVMDVRNYDVEPNKQTVYLTIKLQTVYNPGTNQYTYKGKSVAIGSTLQLYLDQVYIEGLVVEVKGFKKPYPQTKLRITGQLQDYDPKFLETYGVSPYVADSIHQGDNIKDIDGKIILTIVGKTVEDAKKVVTTSSGDVLLRTDPIRKDVTIVFDIIAAQIGNRYYFIHDIPVLIDSAFPINLGKISFWPKVTSIEVIK